MEDNKVVGDVGFLLQDMLTSFHKWEDELCLRLHGFRYSELVRMEMTLARCYISSKGSSAAAIELVKLEKEYKDIWLPRRWKLEERAEPKKQG